jgi:hypothetical protein
MQSIVRQSINFLGTRRWWWYLLDARLVLESRCSTLTRTSSIATNANRSVTSTQQFVAVGSKARTSCPFCVQMKNVEAVPLHTFVCPRVSILQMNEFQKFQVMERTGLFHTSNLIVTIRTPSSTITIHSTGSDTMHLVYLQFSQLYSLQFCILFRDAVEKNKAFPVTGRGGQ